MIPEVLLKYAKIISIHIGFCLALLFELWRVVNALCILACAFLPLIWWSWSKVTESKEWQKTSLPVPGKSSQGTCWVMGSNGVKALGLFGVNKRVIATPSCWIWVSEYLRWRLYVWCNACRVSRMLRCQNMSKVFKCQMTTETNERSWWASFKCRVATGKAPAPSCKPCGMWMVVGPVLHIFKGRQIVFILWWLQVTTDYCYCYLLPAKPP